MSFIGVDLGTSFVKGAVLDLEALHLDHVHRVPFPDPIQGLPPLFREFDPHAVLSAVQDLISNLLPYAAGCEGVVMCSQMQGLVLCTPQGEPRSNLSTWQDQRVLMPHPSGKGSYFQILQERISPLEVRQLGNELRPGQPLCILFCLAEQGRLPSQELIPYSLPDFVLANLCGSPVGTDVTNAAAYGVLNLETVEWHRAVLSNLGLELVHWPTILRQGQVAGWLNVGSTTLPCYTPVGDHQCAVVGALVSSEELSINISTGSQVTLLRPRMEMGNYQTRPYFDGRFLNTITHIPAGRALNLLVKLITELAEGEGVKLQDPWAYIARKAAEVSSTDLSVDLAFFASACGEQGGIRNIREDNLTVGHLFRAAFESIADNYYASALRLSPEKTWRNLVFSGGLAQKIKVLREIICAKFQVDSRLCSSTEDTLLGLLVLALAFSGRAQSVEEATAYYEAATLRAHGLDGWRNRLWHVGYGRLLEGFR